MEEEEPAFLEPIDYSAESNDEYAEADNEHGCEIQETTDDHDPLSDSETSHRDWGRGSSSPLPLAVWAEGQSPVFGLLSSVGV